MALVNIKLESYITKKYLTQHKVWPLWSSLYLAAFRDNLNDSATEFRCKWLLRGNLIIPETFKIAANCFSCRLVLLKG